MSELSEKVQASIERLKAFEPKDGSGYHMAFSGGKDSVVLKRLADMACVKYHAVYRVTSVDPPDLVRFIKLEFPDVRREIPRYRDGSPITMWNLIPKKSLPPTRITRYCCEFLKESAGDGTKTLTGVRWAEGTNRAKNHGIATIKGVGAAKELADNQDFQKTKQGGVVLVNDNEDSRRTVEVCYKRHKTLVNPIIDWTDADVWTFIRQEKIPYCSLYDEGFHRLGCIGCPMASRREREQQFLRWPKYKTAYLKAFGRMLELKKLKGHPFRILGENGAEATAKDVFNWWMEYDTLPGQMDLLEDYDE